MLLLLYTESSLACHAILRHAIPVGVEEEQIYSDALPITGSASTFE